MRGMCMVIRTMIVAMLIVAVGVITVMLVTHFEVHRPGADAEPDSEGVVGRQARGENQNPADPLEARTMRDERFSENQILAEESAGERKSGQAQAAHEHRVRDNLPAR